MKTNHSTDQQAYASLATELNRLAKAIDENFNDLQSRWLALREVYQGIGADEAEIQFHQLMQWHGNLQDHIDGLQAHHLRQRDEEATP
ncbi:hypothetical protein [Photobacterium nomapromontoriensis]|uniref:hypothetical protein n=1 Tax=Photobacterium nomapromontoriensis TaxID=2910237 RepID=UPI003D0C7050